MNDFQKNRAFCHYLNVEILESYAAAEFFFEEKKTIFAFGYVRIVETLNNKNWEKVYRYLIFYRAC